MNPQEKADIVDRLHADLPHHADSFTRMSLEREEAATEIASLRRELAEARERNLLANERADNAVADAEKARETSPVLLNAIRIAINAHDGQTDKLGQPYTLHPLRVMLMANTEQERIVGVLHDVIEDCPDWPKERLALHFSDEIMTALESVTRREGESYEDFVLRAKANPIGREVKMNDLADNLDPARLAVLSPADRDRLKAKYLKAMQTLRGDP